MPTLFCMTRSIVFIRRKCPVVFSKKDAITQYVLHKKCLRVVNDMVFAIDKKTDPKSVQIGKEKMQEQNRKGEIQVHTLRISQTVPGKQGWRRELGMSEQK